MVPALHGVETMYVRQQKTAQHVRGTAVHVLDAETGSVKKGRTAGRVHKIVTTARMCAVMVTVA